MQPGEQLLAAALELLALKLRMERHVGQQVHRQVEILFNHGHGDVGAVVISAGGKRTADEVDRLGNLLCRALPGPLREQVRGHRRHPRLAGRVVQ